MIIEALIDHHIAILEDVKAVLLDHRLFVCDHSSYILRENLVHKDLTCIHMHDGIFAG